MFFTRKVKIALVAVVVLILIIVIPIVVVNYVSGEEPAGPIVELPLLGKVEGVVDTSFKGRTFYSFNGVPYALPPIGYYRFREPQPPLPWDGVKEAKTIYRCLQYVHNEKRSDEYIRGTEDCLYVNIYTPTLNQSANLDVIVFIHGGAFMFGHGGSHGPQYLMDHDVVYINLNYRVGPLGFLSTESDLVPGNNGIRDQIQALRFIKDNVRYFGGNPSSVTISGMSAGGASVHLHYLTPKSRDLFHRGFSQSGCALNAWVLMENALEKTRKVADLVNCSRPSMEELVDCLRTRSGFEILQTIKEIQGWLYNPFSPFGVVVDTWSSDPVLPAHPYELIQRGLVKNAPWIASQTNSEGLYPGARLYKNETWLAEIDRDWNELAPHIFDYNYTVRPDLLDDVSSQIRRFYLGDKKVSRANFMDFIDALSDRMFVVDIQKAARLQASTIPAPVFYYFFTYRGANSRSDSSGTNLDFGASHGDDTNYIFKTARDFESTENDRRMIDFMTKWLVDFARTGSFGSVAWAPLSKSVNDTLKFLKIESPQKIEPTVEEILTTGDFWAGLPIRENEKR